MNTKDKEEYKLLHKQYIDANAIGGDALKKYEASDDYKRYTEYNSSDDEEVLKMLGEVEEEFKDYVYEPNKNKETAVTEDKEEAVVDTEKKEAAAAEKGVIEGVSVGDKMVATEDKVTATEEGEKNPVDTKTTEDTGGETETEEKKPDTETKEEEVVSKTEEKKPDAETKEEEDDKNEKQLTPEEVAEMKEKLIQEQTLAQAKAEKEKRERYDAAMKEIVEAMGDNVKTNERDIVGNRIYNDVFSLGEYLHNKNEPKYQGTATEDTALIVGDRLAADTAIEQINRSKAATVKQLAAAGRHDMIPSVLKEASNKKAELQQNIDNANAQLGMQVKQLNQQSFNQGIELGMKASQFDAQMDAQHEALRGAAMSQNLSNLRDSHRDMTNSLTANRDNKVSYAMYLSALDNPDVLESIQNFMKYKRNRNKRQNVEQQMQDTGQ